MKLIMYKQMYMEQFSFLDNQHILDAIRVDQESLHIIKVKKYKSLIFKVDLLKAYDRVSWDFLRLVLLQVGLILEATNWIMWCVNSVSFVILVNGKPSYLFKCKRVLFQGCMLSPLLFIFIIEGLSWHIHKVKKGGKYLGSKAYTAHEGYSFSIR